MAQKKVEQKRVEYVILGAGSAGLVVAVGLTKAGKDFAVVSKNIGGDCTHFGCVPSKTLLSLAKQYARTTSENEKGKLFNTALKSVRTMIDSFATEEKDLIEKSRFYKATASFTSPGTVRAVMDNKTVEITFSKKCIIATGSRPNRIAVPGISEIITNEEFFMLKRLPSSITIFGAGPVGVELATACALFGIKTYLVSSSFLPDEHTRLSERVLNQLTNNRVVWIRSRPKRLSRGKLHLTNGKTVEKTSCYLSATGRSPNTDIGLENAGITYTKKGIKTDNNLLTSNPNVYAIGDVGQNPQFTHLAASHAKYVVKKILFPLASRKKLALPRVTFTDPPIATVGNLKEGKQYRLFDLDFSESDKGRVSYDVRSRGIVSVNVSNGTIKGASLYGDFAEELISLFTTFIDHKITVLQASEIITPYPTYANILHRLGVEHLGYLRANWRSHPIGTVRQLISYLI